MEITLEDVKAFLESHKEDASVVEFVASISIDKPLSQDVVKGYLETSEGKLLLQPVLDSYASKSINSHDEKKKKEIEAEIARKVNEKLADLNKDDTPEQKMLKEQAQRMRELEEKYENDKKLSKINEIAYKEGIDPGFVEGLSFDSAEQFGLYASRFKDYVKKANEKALNDAMISSAGKPKSGKKENDGKMTFSEFRKLPLTERNRMAETGEIDNLVPD
jgi:septal ring factor EnvC (AmiA/AmiB activator)